MLVSFGGFGLDGLDLASLDCLDSYTVVAQTALPRGRTHTSVHLIDERALYAAGFRYEDLVAAADVVVTKPGYGIIAECLANGTAVLYTSRGRFPEYDVLVAAMPRFLRCAFIEQSDLLAGRWRRALDALRSTPAPPDRPPTNGADVAADLILRRIDRL